MEDMYHFLGIMLKISMEERDGGGYTAYFRKIDKTLLADLDGIRSKTLPASAGWAWRYMSLARFRQIRSAFHPESKTAGVAPHFVLFGDKLVLDAVFLNTNFKLFLSVSQACPARQLALN